MKFFIKQLQSQESGYSGDVPDQRGKYILIPKEAWGDFPRLSELTYNDATPLVLNTRRGPTAVSYVWHNAAYHTSWLGENIRKHDERRIYRNSVVDEALELDRHMIFIIGISSSNDFFATSVKTSSGDFKAWEELARNSKGKLVSEQTIPESLRKSESLITLLNNTRKPGSHSSEQLSIAGLSEVTMNLAKITSERSKTRYRHSQEPEPGDPAAMLLPIIQGQQDFAKVVRDMYGAKCCVRNTRLIADSTIGLEAAHVRAYSEAGPNLPSNGILLSGDLHRAFDAGAFTLTLDHKIEIHTAIDRSSELWKFDRKQVTPESKAYAAFLPFKPYIEWHRDRVFANFV